MAGVCEYCACVLPRGTCICTRCGAPAPPEIQPRIEGPGQTPEEVVVVWDSGLTGPKGLEIADKTFDEVNRLIVEAGKCKLLRMARGRNADEVSEALYDCPSGILSVQRAQHRIPGTTGLELKDFRWGVSVMGPNDVAPWVVGDAAKKTKPPET